MLVQRVVKLQEKAVCLINFEINPNIVGQLLKDNNILKLTDFIRINMQSSLEIHLERKMSQYSMNSTLSLIRIMSITQGDQQIRC